jgi:hypothetical protein
MSNSENIIEVWNLNEMDYIYRSDVKRETAKKKMKKMKKMIVIKSKSFSVSKCSVKSYAQI